MYWHDMAWWAWIPMTFVMVLFWGVLAWLVVRLFSDRDAGRGAPETSARQILDARFARGEIGVGEYEQARRLLDAPRLPNDRGDDAGPDDERDRPPLAPTGDRARA